MSQPRLHHYVQAEYLKGFLTAQSTQLLCYGRRRLQPFPSIPGKLARQRDFYQVPNAHAGANIEAFLEKFIEAPGLAALQNLVGTRCALGIKERVDLARYIAFQEMRVPHARELNREHLSKSNRHMLESLQAKNADRADVQIIALAEGVEAGRNTSFTITREELETVVEEMDNNPETFDLDSMVELANDMTKFYAVMRWTILISRPQAAFITSDCPVFRTFTEQGGDDALLRPDCSVCCPLSSNVLLVMTHDPDYMELSAKEDADGRAHTLPPTVFKTITDRHVANFNKRIADHSHLWCFSGTQQDFLLTAMQSPSKRTKPTYIEHGPFSGARWQRSEVPE